jgi:hypothetical protein
VNYLTTEQFKDHFKFDGETAIISPNVAMIASFIGEDFDACFEPYNAILDSSNHQKYDTVLIDIIEDQKYPHSKAKHEFNWLINSLIFAKRGGSVVAKLPHKILSQISQIKDVTIETATVYDDCAIVKFLKSEDHNSTTVYYSDGVVKIDSRKVPILSQNNSQYYSYFQSVSNQDSFDYISLTAGGKKNCRQQFDDRVDWNPSRVICVSTGADNRRIDNGLKFYTFDQIADINRAVDCFYVPEDVDFESFVNTLNSKKFLSFLSSVCYNNYQTFNKVFKKKVFNKKIIEFCNEE